MSERGLIVKLGAVVEGAAYYRFLAWRRILFEQYGRELSEETGMALSALMPQIAARRLCRALGIPVTPARERTMLGELTQYYAGYLDEAEQGDLLPRAGRIQRYGWERGLTTCLLVPRGERPACLGECFPNTCPAGLGENLYKRAAAHIGVETRDCVLILAEDDNRDFALVSGVGRTIPAADFDAE